MKILAIDDDKDNVQTMKAYMEEHGYDYQIASTRNEALEKIRADTYDCILLNLTLEGGRGEEIREEIRKQDKQSSLVIIASREYIRNEFSEEEKAAANFLIKPYHLSELTAKIEAVTSAPGNNKNNVVRLNGFEINMQSRKGQIHDKEIHFTRKEMDLLMYLIGNKNSVVSKNTLTGHLFGNREIVNDNYDILYAHIKNLKKKLQEVGCEKSLRTVYGVGYKWEPGH